jgi:predicted nucleic acid-binding protein
MNQPRVLIDACVLYDALVRDVLMILSGLGCLEARWTDTIHEEWISSLHRNRPDIPLERLYRVRDLMNLHASDSLVRGYEHRIADLILPDAGDRHVLAAAIESQSNYLLTFNKKDFPAEMVSVYGLEVLDPDRFLMDLWKKNPTEVARGLRIQYHNFKNPPLTAQEYKSMFIRHGLDQTAEIVTGLDLS